MNKTDSFRKTGTLVVEDVTKLYKGRRRDEAVVAAVKNVSFSLPAGGTVGLVGASGSGKSTLARLVTGAERPSSGNIIFSNYRVGRLGCKDLRRYHGDVQLVFQDPYAALNPLNTVSYTLIRPIINYLGFTVKQARQQVNELLELVGLTPVEQFGPKLPHQLSGGQRQRVVLARALACKPQLLVADEPVSMLDVSLRAEILSLLDQLRKQTGISLVYITHDLLSARLVADNLLVLNDGQVVEQGPTLEVLRNPQNEYTKKLLDALPNPSHWSA